MVCAAVGGLDCHWAGPCPRVMGGLPLPLDSPEGLALCETASSPAELTSGLRSLQVEQADEEVLKLQEEKKELNNQLAETEERLVAAQKKLRQVSTGAQRLTVSLSLSD